MTSIGVWAPQVFERYPQGPSLALRRMLAHLPTEDEELRFHLVHEPLGDVSEHITGHGEMTIGKTARGWLNLQRAGFAGILVNGIPSSIPSLAWHQYVKYRSVVWVHGTLAWAPDYAAADVSKKANSIERVQTKAIMALAARSFHTLVANSGFTQRVLQESLKVPPERTRVIRYGLDHGVFRVYNDEELGRTRDALGLPDSFLVYVAHYNPIKGPFAALRAYARVARTERTDKLVIVGHGYERSTIPELARELCVEDSVIFVGAQDERTTAHIYNLANLCLFPSLHETFGMPVLEAMACACPVVSTKATGIPETAEDAASLIEDPLDSEGVAQATLRILRDPAAHRAYVEAGLARAQAFDWCCTAGQFLDLFRNLGGK